MFDYTHIEVGLKIWNPHRPVFAANHKGRVRAYYNVCRHRGAKLVREPASKKNVVTCPYHHVEQCSHVEAAHFNKSSEPKLPSTEDRPEQRRTLCLNERITTRPWGAWP